MVSINSTNGLLRGVLDAVMCECVVRISPFKHRIPNGIQNAFFVLSRYRLKVRTPRFQRENQSSILCSDKIFFFLVGCLQRTKQTKESDLEFEGESAVSLALMDDNLTPERTINLGNPLRSQSQSINGKEITGENSEVQSFHCLGFSQPLIGCPIKANTFFSCCFLRVSFYGLQANLPAFSGVGVCL